MYRLAVIALFVALSLPVRAQMFSHGVPASVNSPTADGQQHGIPASVTSPSPIPAGVHIPLRQQIFQGPHHRFGKFRDHQSNFVPVPVFYPIYGYGDPAYPIADPYVSSQPQQDPNAAANQANEANGQGNGDDQLRAAYLQGARDALRETLARNGDSRSNSADPR